MTANNRPLRVFLCHSSDDKPAVRELYKKLIASGVDAWLDEEKLLPGQQWKIEIPKAVHEADVAIVFLSKKSITKEGYVQNEIRFVLDIAQEKPENTIYLIPARLEECQVPFRLSDWQWVNLYEQRGTELLFASLQNRAESLGLIFESSLLSSKKPPYRLFGIETLIMDKTEGFVGREYIFSAIEKFILDHDSGYMIIEGDPGMGKSAILAEYVRRTNCIAHFNIRSSGITSFEQFLENVCLQLVQRLGIDSEDFAFPTKAREYGAFFNSLLELAGSRIVPGERLIIAVDALDEVDIGEKADNANILYLPALLPENIYFILTRRPGTGRPFQVQTHQIILDLLKLTTESLTDIKTYLEKAVERPGIAGWIRERHDLSEEILINALAQKSESNFMYLRYVLASIESGLYKDLNIKEIPDGLIEYYEDHWTRMGMMSKPLPETKLKIVYILAEVHKPISRILISKISSTNERVVQEILDEWRQFLHSSVIKDLKTYSIYHSSFREFLHRKDIVASAGIELERINSLIADEFWDDLFES